ncbi:matrixin family metalloprotease [Methanosarcina barkeri]|uniref:Peptidase M10 family n=1 Tax=Methanosarcina barkeri CM1 TaxID=796385 RepID=A0A0G3CF37_METBA|nr:matrixin family metalloprotease [Methanosarcina barkeri]AKJ39345.1 peptidase M10 family [Methanosarcina barkeri CM1]
MKQGKRLLIGMLLLIIFLVNMATPVSAYSVKGFYWHSGYATMHKDSSIPSTWTTSLNNAASAWTNAGADFYYSWVAASDNILYYTPLSNNSILATTYYDATGDVFNRFYIEFNSNKAWSTASNGESGKFDVQSVTTHEFGHGLGLGHSIVAWSTTMIQGTATGDIWKRSLHSDDINGIKSIY